MSHGVTTDVVKFLAWLGEENDYSDDSGGPTLLKKLCDPPAWLECQEEEPEEFLLSENGWSHDAIDSMGTSAVDFGKRARLYGYPWTKGDFKVYCWNSSEASNVGYLSASVASDDRASIEAFMADFKNEFGTSNLHDIMEDDTAEQWG